MIEALHRGMSEAGSGDTSISWPPVCATPLTMNCPPATVPLESHSSSF
jgi:hypothetical protein